MLSSPRRPSSTMRIFSSAEWCRRVARRISRTVFSALSGTRLLACLIVAPQQGYDEPGILSYAIRPFCPTSADGLHAPLSPWLDRADRFERRFPPPLSVEELETCFVVKDKVEPMWSIRDNRTSAQR